MKYKVPFLDLRVTDGDEKRMILESVSSVMDHGRIVLGPEVSKLEKKIATFCGRKYAVGINSGTDALILGLKSLGIGPGDEVITTSLSWIATANAIAMVGAIPVFADTGEDLNIDPVSVEKLITKRTKAILPVHYTGRICRMDDLIAIARKHKVFLIEDAAQAFGAKIKSKAKSKKPKIQGKRQTYSVIKAGGFGDIACFSMNPMKVYAALGEAGFVVTDDQTVYARLISLRYNGTVNKETCIATSFNGRMDTLQAAILLVRFSRFQKNIAKRRKNAAYYFKHLSGIPYVKLPFERGDEYNVYYTYTLQVQKRDELREFLDRFGIETKIQHPILMPEQPIYAQCTCDDLKTIKRLHSEIVCIPIHEKLRENDLEYIVKHIRMFYAEMH